LDYVFTLYSARLYATRVKGRLVFEGSFELTPYFQKDVDSGRRLSPRFIFALLLGAAWISMMWALTRQPPRWPQAYAFVLGMMVLSELAIHVRHVRNLFLFRWGFGLDGIQGRMTYPRPLVLRMSAVELLAFSLLFALASVVIGSPFLAGGATTCAAIAVSHRRLARRAAASQAHPPSSTEGHGRRSSPGSA
jgi:hypothetical protein